MRVNGVRVISMVDGRRRLSIHAMLLLLLFPAKAHATCIPHDLDATSTCTTRCRRVRYSKGSSAVSCRQFVMAALTGQNRHMSVGMPSRPSYESHPSHLELLRGSLPRHRDLLE
ncbi:hypothetical protein J3F83DRAFT_724720 [Trichoderma novae-zelandiae]